jgi:hypothetical protein
MCDRLVWNFHREEFSNESLGLSGTALLLVALPGHADQSNPGQAVPAQPDGAALMQKIRDLEDRVIAMEGPIRQFKG